MYNLLIVRIVLRYQITIQCQCLQKYINNVLEREHFLYDHYIQFCVTFMSCEECLMRAQVSKKTVLNTSQNNRLKFTKTSTNTLAHTTNIFGPQVDLFSPIIVQAGAIRNSLRTNVRLTVLLFGLHCQNDGLCNDI